MWGLERNGEIWNTISAEKQWGGVVNSVSTAAVGQPEFAV